MKKHFLPCLLALILTGCFTDMPRQFKTDHFIFYYDQHYDASEARKVAGVLEHNYNRIGQDLDTRPANPIDVFLYSKRWIYATTHGHWTSAGNIEGDNKLHFLQHGSDEQNITCIAIHEFAHAVMLRLLLDREPRPLNGPAFDKKFATFPIWLYEALAVYEAHQFIDPKTLPFLANGHYPSLDELNSRTKGQKIYKVGYTLIEYLLQAYGKEKLLQFISGYGDLRILHTTPAAFSKAWYTFVQQKYF